MAALADKSAARKLNLRNLSGERNGNDHGLLQEQRHFFELVLTATATTRKTDQDTATTATEKTTLNQVHSGPKDWEHLNRSRRQMLEGGFTEVHEKLEWEGWLLQHHPINTPRKLLCGHIHEKWLRIGWIINVGVDVWDFTPRTIEELILAEESPREYKCRYCGTMLKRLEDNSAHHDEKCIATHGTN